MTRKNKIILKEFIKNEIRKKIRLKEDHMDSDLPQPAMDLINHVMDKYGKNSPEYNKVEKAIFNIKSYIKDYNNISEIIDDEDLEKVDDYTEKLDNIISKKEKLNK